MDKIIYKPKGEKYGFIIFPAKYGDNWGEIADEDHLFIYYSDFEYIINSLRIVYPLLDPDTNKIEEAFDVCGMNWIPNKSWNRIINNLKLKTYTDIDLYEFIEKFCSWIIDKQLNSDEIMVYGTL